MFLFFHFITKKKNRMKDKINFVYFTTHRNDMELFFQLSFFYFLLQLDENNNYKARFLGFSLFVSNTTNRLDGFLCFKDTNFTYDTIPDIFTTTCPVHGQYVILYNERLPGVTYPSYYYRYALNEVCEVEVFGEYLFHICF